MPDDQQAPLQVRLAIPDFAKPPALKVVKSDRITYGRHDNDDKRDLGALLVTINTG
jgi:hypothetical protein